MRFETFSSIEAIDRRIWNDMARSASPMMEWEYHCCLERSASISPLKGYQPFHTVAFDGTEPVAIAPLFERDRAWVEFGDGGLVELLHQMTGLPFHRGLVGTIPYTPVPNYQFLYRADVDATKVQEALLAHIDALCEEKHLATSRIYFVSSSQPELHALLRQQGYLGLRSDYCLWINNDYQNFEDFLKVFKSSRRTKIKRELRTITEKRIQIDMVAGGDAPSSYFEDMHELYVNTWTKHMGYELRPFLNRDFFKLLGELFRHRTKFSVAACDEKVLGMGIFYEKSARLYGRYWGCFEEVPFLHFATCYYHPIRHAIENHIKTVDPGFGGEHKLYRGFNIVPVHHYIKFHGATERRVAYSIINQAQAHVPLDKADA